jgi:chaperonin cofactor prefoldin|tara:strand:+ start:1672 stop:1827 length:156 start_codon:yes stop_codon:yes gene_type:complete
MQKLQEKGQKLIEERNQLVVRLNEINGALAILNELAQEENTTEVIQEETDG